MAKDDFKKITDLVWVIPTLLLVIFIPSFIYVKINNLSYIYFLAWNGEKISIDLFAYYRSLILIAVSVCLGILLVVRQFDRASKFSHNIAYLPLLLYLLFVIISTVFAEYWNIALFGFIERYEGTLVIASYVILFVCAHQLINSLFVLKATLYSYLISSSIIALVGIPQFFGYDIFNSDVFRSLILSNQDKSMISSFIIKHSGNVIYATLYNPNNVGTYMSMMFLISFALFCYIKAKKKAIILAIHSCLMFALLIGSRSRAGLIAVSFSMLLFLVFQRITIMKNRMRLMIIIPYMLIFLIMNAYSGDGLLNKMLTLFPQVEQSLSEDRRTRVDDIKLDRDTVQISTETDDITINRTSQATFSFQINDTGFSTDTLVPDSSDELILIEAFFDQQLNNEYSYRITEFAEYDVLQFNINQTKLFFRFEKANTFIIGTRMRLYDTIQSVPSIGFKNYQSFGSGRGYIWSKTLPILKDTLIIGKGPDTYALYFPQHDILGKLSRFGNANILVDKPHNYYIQVAHGSGLISLVCLMIFFSLYFIQTYKVIRNKSRSSRPVQFSIMIACSVLGYLIVSFFNDSVVYVAPIFWILLGTGFAVNDMIRKEETDADVIPISELSTEVNNEHNES